MEEEDRKKAQFNVPRYGAKTNYAQYEDPDKKPVKMTESLKILDETRKQRTAFEVEQEFKSLNDKKLNESKKQSSPSKQTKKTSKYDYILDEEDQEDESGFKREKSKCLLLKS